MKIGLRIKELRKQAKITQPELAEKIGVHETTIRRWEQGKDKGPSVDIIPKIANALGTSVAYLMGETDNPVLGVSEEPEQLQLQKAEKPQDISYINSEKTEDDLGLSYWGSVVDNARRVAKFGNYENMFDVSEMLKRAQASLSIAMGHVSPA